jgi:uncharacterized protein (DUF488 family)
MSHFFSIGHSNHAIEEFVDLLKRHGITAVADVRSQPYSRRNPQFNRERLAAALKRASIAYVFVGAELGARSQDPACYENGQIRYARLAETALFKSGIERVLAGAQKFSIALMCAEKEPLDCHRTLLVARALQQRGAEIEHILADGTIETHAATLQRLLAQQGLSGADLFGDAPTLIEEACRRHEAKVAFVKA